MREIAVVSGKGGVGKTSLSAALAQLLAPLAVADADVDAADLHLVLPHRQRSSIRVCGGHLAQVTVAECWGCTACVQTCRFGAIVCDPKARIDALACEGCGACAYICAAEAITLVEREHGSLIEAEAAPGPLVYARLDPGAENSGKLVARVRERTRQLAGKAGLETVLIDGPPGCGCAATAALTGCDLVVAVCEPSMSALADLHRLLDLIAHFRLPVLAVINKADLHPVMSERIGEELAHRQVPVVAHLPYDPVVTEAQRQGCDLTVLADGVLRQELDALAAAITDTLAAGSQQ